MFDYVLFILYFFILISVCSFGTAVLAKDFERCNGLRSFIHILFIAKSAILIGYHGWFEVLLDKEMFFRYTFDTIFVILTTSSIVESKLRQMRS